MYFHKTFTRKEPPNLPGLNERPPKKSDVRKSIEPEGSAQEQNVASLIHNRLFYHCVNLGGQQ
jgi:hypothetical protein